MISRDIFNQCIYKVWLLCIVNTNLSINGKKKKLFHVQKLSMRNDLCEIRLCARALLAQQGSCRIW